jgi:hypothetical protein
LPVPGSAAQEGIRPQRQKAGSRLADACLVRMSELVADCVVFTLDWDFRIYRRHGRQKIPLLIPTDR